MPRIRVHVQGVVQGVGFRPFVYRLALERHLTGWVRNRPDGVELEIEGPTAAIQGFLAALRVEKPAPARIREVTVEDRAELREADFRIVASGASEATRPSVPADLAICPECAAELSDPGQRRYQYPFTNCTYCGPRFTIIEGLPYDRPRTAMKGFPLCPACEAEYRDPLDRRFHAQPVACPECGPQISLLGRAGSGPAIHREAALAGAVEALRAGQILALKGLGGFQLLVDASSAEAVARLRARKGREEKPFAVMFGGLAELRAVCAVSAEEAELLTGPEAPVLLLERLAGWADAASPLACRDACSNAESDTGSNAGSNADPIDCSNALTKGSVAAGVAPRNPRLGAFLPYTPLHALLLAKVGGPLVCTSGNLSDEPMCYQDEEAFERLGGIADAFLVHNRPILRPVDDSVLRLDSHGPTLLRRARGFAPMAVPLPLPLSGLAAAGTVLALGAHQKNTLCLLSAGQAVVSQHLGDLHSAEGVALLERTVADFLAFFQARPERLACDLHPDYASTRLGERLAKAWDRPLLRVQHHHAHVAACAAEHGLSGPLTGLAWDGSGLGSDGTLWGGEALTLDGAGFQRVGHLGTFPLPGGERAVRSPGRCALGLLWAAFGPRALDLARDWFPAAERSVLGSVLERGLNAPRTSSVGRLFDGVAALLGIRAGQGFEGQAAMELEFAAQRGRGDGSYPWSLAIRDGVLVADPAPLLEALLADRRLDVPAEQSARRFHHALADLALAFARHAGRERVLLTGGCFQNALLTGLVRGRLAADGFQPISPQAFPPNDGAIALGQAAVAAWAG